MTMDYSPCSERENWLFLRVVASPKPERSRPPKLVYMHVTSILTCMNFLSQFRSIKFFDDHGLYKSMVRKGNLAIFESCDISETQVVTPTKTGVHVCDINPYLHEFFEPILLNSHYHKDVGVYCRPVLGKGS